MPPVAAAGAAAGAGAATSAVVGGIATVAAAGITAAAQGGGSSASGFTLPPALELQMLDHFQENLRSLDEDYAKYRGMSEAYDSKIAAIDGLLNNTIPSADALRQITEANMNLAKHLNLSADELAQNNFLTPEEAAGLKKLEEMDSANFEDVPYKNKLADQKARLMQDLRRQGASQATIDQAMRQADRDIEEKMFTRSQELKTSQAALITGRLGLGRSLRTAGQTEALNALQAGGLTLQQAQNALVTRGNLAGAAAQTGAGLLEAQQRTAQQRDIGGFQEIGKFLLSKTSRRLLQSGGIGAVPGVYRAAAASYAIGNSGAGPGGIRQGTPEHPLTDPNALLK